MTTHRIRARQIPETYIEKLRALQPLARAALRKMDRSLPVDIPETETKLCRRCGEHWPATDEFFYRSADTRRLRSPCRCCIDEKRAKTNLVKPCAHPGCNKPRCGSRSSYCDFHHTPRNRKMVY